MSGNNVVADTSLLVNFFNGLDLAKRVMEGRTIWISCITEIELLSYQKLSGKEDKLGSTVILVIMTIFRLPQALKGAEK